MYNNKYKTKYKSMYEFTYNKLIVQVSRKNQIEMLRRKY